MWLLTTQPSLIRALETKAIPRSVEQVQVNQSYFGYVASIQPFGVFVSFLDTLQALVPLRYLSSRFVKDAKDVVRVGQAVRVTCTDIKEKKVEASLLGANDAETEMLYMLSLEEEQLRLMDLGKTLELNVSDEEEEEEEESDEEEEEEEEANNTSDNEDEEKEDEDEEEKDSDAMEEEEEEEAEEAEEEDKPFDWKACPLGTVCSGHIKTVRDYGVIVEMDNGFIGFAPSPLHTENISLTEGTAVTARILDVNASLQLYDITLSQRFLPDSTSTSPSPSLAQGESVQGTIVVQKPDYVVLALNTPAKSLVLGSMTSFNNAKQPFSGLNLGDEVDCTLLCAPGVGGAVCDLRNAFKDTLSAADSEAIRSFFAEVSVGDLSSKSTSKDASKGSSKARLLSDKAMELPRELVGKKVTVRVVEITPSVVFVALPKSVAEGNGSVAAIWATDVDGKKEGKWPETIVKDATVEAK